MTVSTHEPPQVTKSRSRQRWIEAGALLVILALAALLRGFDLTGESLWYDEAYSVWSSSMDIASLRTLWQWQIEFPIYYLLLHYWMCLFGSGEIAVRAFGALAGALSIVPMYYLGRALFDWRVGALGAALLAVNPYHIWYSQEVRMYAWALLVTLASVYAFWRLATDEASAPGARWGWWTAYVLLTGVVFHLHYYIGWIVLVENLYYLGRCCLASRQQLEGGLDIPVRSSASSWRMTRRWLLGQIGILLIALPAFAVFRTKLLGFNQWDWLGQRYGAPGPAQVLDLLVTYGVGTAFPGPSYLRWVIVALLLALSGLGFAGTMGWIRPHRRGTAEARRARSGLVFVALALLVPLGLVYLLGQISTLWVPRYLILMLPFLLLLTALGIQWLGRALGSATLALLTIASLYALSGMYMVQQKEDWRGVVDLLSRQVGSQDMLVLMDEECRVPFDYYASRENLAMTSPRVEGADASLGVRRIGIGRFAGADELDEAVRQISAAGSQRQEPARLWLIVSHADGSRLEERLNQLPGLGRVGPIDFVGIRLIVYEWLSPAAPA